MLTAAGFGDYSADADQVGLTQFVTGLAHWADQDRACGEGAKQHTLAEELRQWYEDKGRVVEIELPGS